MDTYITSDALVRVFLSRSGVVYCSGCQSFLWAAVAAAFFVVRRLLLYVQDAPHW